MVEICHHTTTTLEFFFTVYNDTVMLSSCNVTLSPSNVMASSYDVMVSSYDVMVSYFNVMGSPCNFMGCDRNRHELATASDDTDRDDNR